jgi:cytochrome P450
MERLTGLIEEVTEREVASWSAWADEPELALAPKMQRLTLEIILRAVFGLDPGPRLDALRSRLSALAAYGDKPITMLLPPPPDNVAPVLDRIGPAKGFVRLRNEIDALLFELIEERRADEAGNSERDDVLSTLLEARHEDGSPMSDQELRDELMTLLLAGHETTASTLAWAFERLVRTPAALERLVAEATESDADADDPYLAATIQETLRCRPVLPNTAPRLVVEPIEVGGRRYEPGRRGPALVANAYLLHHDPDVYPDPYTFRPERFLDQAPGTYTWIPFGGGRRRCIGASFATLEMRIVMRAILRTYDVRPLAAAHEHAVRRNITVRPGAGSRIGIGRRPAPVAAAR